MAVRNLVGSLQEYLDVYIRDTLTRLGVYSVPVKDTHGPSRACQLTRIRTRARITEHRQMDAWTNLE